MTPRFLLSPEAESDLGDIKRLVLAEGGPRIALHVMRSLLKAIRLLAGHPGLGHVRQDLTDLPLRFWPVFSYLIIYDWVRRPIEIVGVVHGARNVSRVLPGRG